MDRKIDRKFWSKKRITFLSIALITVVSLVFFASKAIGFNHRVAKDRIQTSKVLFDDFNETIAVSGNVEPKVSTMINALEGGRIEEIFIEEGAMVEQGQKLMRLSNTALSLDFMNRETQIIEQINNLRNTRIALQQNQRQNEDQLISIENQLKLIERQFLADTMLARKNAISEIEYFYSQQNYSLAKKQHNLAKERVVEDELYRKTQIRRIDESIGLMERNLEAIRAHLENLIVKAPISGKLNSFDHELGANLLKGQNIGRVDNLDGYKISARVDQYYLNRVAVGFEAEFDYAGKKYWLQVSKVSSSITNGQFEMEFEFRNEIPSNLTRGQIFQIRVLLSATTKAYVIPNGAFFQSSGGQWVYVFDADGNAVKRDISTGRQNTRYIEVLDGLTEGEEIIISSYDNFKEHQKLTIIE